MANHPTGRISLLAELCNSYDNILCDVWGVLHNGVQVYDEAAQALIKFRQQGGRVVMLTNSPRPNVGVIAQFADLGVPDGVFDAVVTSGDATRNLINQTKAEGRGPFYHLGPDRDKPLFDTLDIEFSSVDECRTIVCTGMLDDEVETPEDYRARLQHWVDKGVAMICANPDLVAERGDRMVHCAGSLAKLFDELGGETMVAGKPCKPIYDLSMAKLDELSGGKADKSRTIAIGDGMPTDVAGAQNNGFDLLYISAGIHSADYGPANNPDEAALERFLKSYNATPTVWMPRLAWT